MAKVDNSASDKSAAPVTIREQRAAHAREIPGGRGRMHAFPSKLRAQLVTRDGKNFYQVEGYATVFNRSYEMWDMFGSYRETMDAGALDQSLSANPDVAFLLNHRGMTMARTTNGTLELSKDATGLHVQAFLNADRQDVRDMASAINDGLIDEMSFAFMLNDGKWNDDYTDFTITEADINRGDVSAVNYGANPYTSISARAAEFMELAERVPTPVGRAIAGKLLNRGDVWDEAATAVLGRYRRFCENAAKNFRGAYGIPQTATRAADADDDPKKLLASLDAVLDEAVGLAGGVDREGLPEAVAQALDLLTGAESIVDNLMTLMGVFDPDDDDSTEDRAPSSDKTAERSAETGMGMPVDLIAKRFEMEFSDA